jgi:beta-N-acetylhexosaminidase
MVDPALRRLANSVLWPGFEGTTAPRWLERELADGLAGVVYFEQNIEHPEQVRALSDRIHALHPGSLIGVDEEGGIVTRLEAQHGSSTPGNAVLGRLDDVELTRAAAAWTGAIVAAAGIDVDLAPTVDVNVDPRNPVIGVRSFGADPELVSRHTAAAVRGLQSAGIAACAKHFPGHGDTSTDSHLALAVTNGGPGDLADVHLRPFTAAVRAGVKAVMTAHLRVPHLGDAPATVNPRTLGILRDLGFDGVIVSDALDMAAIRHTLGMGPGGVAALLAGVDLLCVGNPHSNPPHPAGDTDEQEFLEVRDALVAAMAAGELPPAVVEAAAERVRTLRSSLDAQAARHGEQPDPAACGIDWAAAARKAVGVTGDPRLGEGTVTLVDARTKRNIAVGSTSDRFGAALAPFRELRRVSLADHPDESAAVEHARAAIAGARTPLLVVNQPQSNGLEAAVLRAALEARPSTVVIVAGWPGQAGEEADGVSPRNAVYAYGSGRVNAEAVAGLLVGG